MKRGLAGTMLSLLAHMQACSALVTKEGVTIGTAVSANLSLDLYRQSLRLNAHMQRIASALPLSDDTRALLTTFRLCAHCNKYERIGEANDGGYVMCMDGLDKGIVGAMSYGISGYDGWGMQVASRFHVPLHEYDCTNDRRPEKCAGCQVEFHSECILSDSDMPQIGFKTLSDQIQDAGFAGKPKGSLLMKMDVESAEWNVFASMDAQTLQQFREIVVEFHSLDDMTKHAVYLQAVKNLEDAGFRVTHLHGNNFVDITTFGHYMIPKVLEVTYVQGQGCASNIPYHLPLDHPNDPSSAELVDAELPTPK